MIAARSSSSRMNSSRQATVVAEVQRHGQEHRLHVPRRFAQIADFFGVQRPSRSVAVKMTGDLRRALVKRSDLR